MQIDFYFMVTDQAAAEISLLEETTDTIKTATINVGSRSCPSDITLVMERQTSNWSTQSPVASFANGISIADNRSRSDEKIDKGAFVVSIIRKALSLSIVGGLLTLTAGIPLRAQTITQLKATEKARASVLKLGVGPTSRVEITLNDKSKVKGYISEAGQDAFTVKDSQSGSSQKINYSDVAQVKKPGSGLSTGTWLIIGGAAAAAVVVSVIAKPAFCDGGAQSRFPC